MYINYSFLTNIFFVNWQFFLSIMEEDHYTVYCINLIHDRIDILDSSLDDHRLYHEVVGNRIIPRLNLLFQEATDGKF